MSDEIEIAGIRIAQSDWESTPASVKALVNHLVSTIAQLNEEMLPLTERVAQLSERVVQLEEQISQDSKNSSKPPSSDDFAKSIKPKSKRGKRKRGAQAGHQGQQRDLYPMERCDEVIEHYPSQCKSCGTVLVGEDEWPYRHQIVELPEIKPIITEHRLHRLVCPHCGEATRTRLPVDVCASGYGERLSGVVGLLSGVYRQSHQQVCSLLGDVFNIKISCGSVNRLRQELNQALSQPVAAAHDYVSKRQSVIVMKPALSKVTVMAVIQPANEVGYG